jgi:hypothetical protein
MALARIGVAISPSFDVPRSDVSERASLRELSPGNVEKPVRNGQSARRIPSWARFGRRCEKIEHDRRGDRRYPVAGAAANGKGEAAGVLAWIALAIQFKDYLGAPMKRGPRDPKAP